MHLPNTLIVLSLVLLPALGCGSRSLPGSADAGARDVATKPEPDLLPPDAMPGADGCVRPPGGCYSSQDCAFGSSCLGCHADPCCPMCAVCYGRCEPGCLDNANCGPGAYCYVEGACQVSGAKLGACRPRPTGGVCADPNVEPVCGCDGKVYGCAEAAAQAGINVAADVLGCLDCDSLFKLYKLALNEGKSCFPGATGPQCDTLVQDALFCSCPTFISAKPDVLARIDAILKVSAAKACGSNVDCAAVPCAQPVQGSCTSTGGINGRCTDNWP